MSDYTCPHCGAEWPENAPETFGFQFDCPECHEHFDLTTVAEPSAEPPGKRLVVQATGRQLVICILPGGNAATRSMGVFATVWLGFMAFFTGGVLKSGGFKHGGLVAAILFITVFWSAGFLFLYLFIRGRFGKTYVLIDPDRLVIKTELFGRERFKEYPLDGDSYADQVLSYTQNNQPIYAVAVHGAGRTAKFGTFLGLEEKDWLVDRINQHLRASADDHA